MAQAAEQGASEVWLTSDNPRTESPSAILSQVAAGFGAQANVHIKEDRAEAIAAAIHNASAKDVVLIAGKGHEQEQIIGTERFPFSDRSEEHTSELQSRFDIVCRLLLEKK